MRSGILFGFGAAFLILIVNGISAYHGARALTDSQQQVDHSFAIRTQLGLLVADLNDAQTARRDYVFLEAQEKHRSAYFAAIDHMQSRLLRLRELCRGHPEQENRLDDLAEAMSRAIPVLSQTVELREANGFEAARDDLMTERGRALAAVVRDREADMLRAEDALLQQQFHGFRADAGGVAMLFTIMTALALAPLVAIVFLYRRELRDRSQADERFRLAVESAPNAMVMVDAQGAIVLVNGTTERLFGYSRDELLGQPVEMLVPERFRGNHRGFRKQFFASPQSRAMGAGRDLYGVRKSGEEFPVEIGLNPIQTRNGVLVLSAIVDITERHRAAAVVKDSHQNLKRHMLERVAELEARKEAEERFRLAVESAPNAMVMVDAQGSIVLVNSTAERLFGYARDELLGQTVEILVPDWVRKEHCGFREQFFANPESRPMGAGRDLFGVRKNGEEFPVEIGLNPIKTRDGLLVLSAIVDITERHRAAQLLLRAHDELERRVRERTTELETSNKELEAFSYSVSHDLRAPLRAIDGFSRILLKEHAADLSDEARIHLQSVRDNTLQMGRLVDDLLAFSRLGRQALRRQRVSVKNIVLQCIDELRRGEDGRQIELRVGELPPCSADPALLRQVWTNLLSNAFKYTRKQDAAVVEVGSRVDAAPGSRTYFVRDNGVGFNMQYAHKLFGVFQRLHRAEDYEGTGVGLAIVQRIVHRHGGKVWAESSAGQGATFYFTLGDGAISNG